jgi:hypothetical protein
MFHVGALASLLPPGMSQYGLAQELSAHMRAVRGYRWAISGYHATGQGFWLSAAYYGDGLFLVDGARNHGGARDVDLLVQAFRSKLVQPDDQGMLDPALYASEVVHLSMAPPIAVTDKQSILRSPQCSLSPRQGLRRVCIVEFLPLTTGINQAPQANGKAMPQGGATASTPSSAAASPVPAAPPPRAATGAVARGLKRGDTCNVCMTKVEDQPGFMHTYLGCKCG